MNLAARAEGMVHETAGGQATRFRIGVRGPAARQSRQQRNQSHGPHFSWPNRPRFPGSLPRPGPRPALDSSAPPPGEKMWASPVRWAHGEGQRCRPRTDR